MPISADNKRIAINTLALYLRMIISMAVSLYTSRIVLKALGVEDYGVYSVVGGIVGFMAFFNNSMATSVQRFLNYEMGVDKTGANLPKIYSLSLEIYCAIILLGLIIAETLGQWFVLEKLNLGSTPTLTVIIVYQTSIISFALTLFNATYTAVIIAKEDMKVFAYIGMAFVVGKLLIALALTVIPDNRLIWYSLMWLSISIFESFVHVFYCKCKYSFCRFNFTKDKTLFRGMMGFSGYMLFGTVTNVISRQGLDVLINLFFGVVLNASKAIAQQVYNAVNTFISNFLVASQPQVVKLYAAGKLQEAFNLTIRMYKFSSLLLLVLSMPVVMETYFLIHLWLGEVPPYTVIITRLTLIDLFVILAFNPIGTLSQAHGNIKFYQIFISIMFTAQLIGTWCVFKLGFPVESAFYMMIILDLVGLLGRLKIINSLIGFPIKEFMSKGVCQFLITASVATTVCVTIKMGAPEDNFVTTTARLILYVLATVIAAYYLGLNKSERKAAVELAASKFKKVKV